MLMGKKGALLGAPLFNLPLGGGQRLQWGVIREENRLKLVLMMWDKRWIFCES